MYDMICVVFLMLHFSFTADLQQLLHKNCADIRDDSSTLLLLLHITLYCSIFSAIVTGAILATLITHWLRRRSSQSLLSNLQAPDSKLMPSTNDQSQALATQQTPVHADAECRANGVEKKEEPEPGPGPGPEQQSELETRPPSESVNATPTKVPSQLHLLMPSVSSPCASGDAVRASPCDAPPLRYQSRYVYYWLIKVDAYSFDGCASMTDVRVEYQLLLVCMCSYGCAGTSRTSSTCRCSGRAGSAWCSRRATGSTSGTTR